MGYLYIFLTILFTIYGQIILKWRINFLNWKVQETGIFEIVIEYLKLLIDPYILSGFIAAFIASIFWILTMTKFELTFAYPFMSISPALVFLFGIFFLQETFTYGKILGLILIIIGIIITVKF